MMRINTFLIQFLTILWFSSLVSTAKDSIAGKSMDTIFSEANQQFEQANTAAMIAPAEAQDLYQQAGIKFQYLVEHVDDPSAALYINLGNVHFLSGEHGHAVLNYQRALRIDPTQADALHNLHYLRSITVDELPMSRSQQVADALLFWHRWPVAVRITLLALSNILFWGLMARLLYQRKRWHWIALAGSGAVALTFSLSLCASQQGWGQETDAVIVAREVIARQGNGYIYDNAFTSPLHAGTEFTILESRGDWHHARLLNGKSCWLPAKSSQLFQP
ncbi:MAG: tetratricopeptide repeat protein [Rubritalea sp.]|uniref:tetratricopeptide repeat protein n=1 Tax=Rubritalea sp. TaxID=2109375 RepID=UPI00324213CA